MKWLIAGAVAIVGLLVLLAAGGTGWFLYKVDQFLTPPAAVANQPSIASYAEPVSVTSTGEADLIGNFSWEDIANPPKHARAWTRWWWPGGDVNRDTVIEQLALLDEAGFGGVEVQPFLSGMLNVANNEALMQRVYSFDTAAYYETLQAAIEAADERGMQVDLTHFSGWPPGGPEVNLDDSQTLLVYGETSIAGGQHISIELPKPKAGLSEYIFSMLEFAGADFTNFPAEHARLLSVVAARRSGKTHSANPFNLADKVTLEPDSIQLITGRVENGKLRWQAPEGQWHIIASYLMPSGEVPMGAAQKPQGFVVDHLRQPQVLGHYEYAFGERTGLPAHYGEGLRGIFNDSLEFRLKRMSVDGILQEFKNRRGYDLEPYLPAVYIEGVDNVYFREIMGLHAAPEFQLTAMDERIRHDYQQTLSDLVIERFVETSANWAAQRGLVSRAQSYGMDIDILRALGSNTIPETEQLWAGGMDVGLKFASSAAALYGRPLVSAESFVWINRDYMPTARRIKAAADKMFLNGINHIIYHGTPYPWFGANAEIDESDDDVAFGDEGWAPFTGPENPAHFSSNVSPGNTALWPDVPALNDYIARSQYLLRQGGPVMDVLIYYPFLGFHGPNPTASSEEALIGGSLPDADPSNVATEDPTLTAGKQQLDKLLTLPEAHTDERIAWVENLQPLLRTLDRHGISWGWLNGHALQTGKLAAGALPASSGQYRAILLPDIETIDQPALQSLRDLSANGVPVYLAGRRPQHQPGFKEAENGDRAIRGGVRELIDVGATHIKLDERSLLAALAKLPKRALERTEPSDIKHFRRTLADGAGIHFFANQDVNTDAIDLRVTGAEPLWWFDALSGTAWPAQPENGRLSLSLGGLESRFLLQGVPLQDALKQQPPNSLVVQQARKRWSLPAWDFSSADYTAYWEELPDWRSVPALRHAKNGRYRSDFSLPAKQQQSRYLLNLGLVQGSAMISVNDQPVGRASLPPFILDVSEQLHGGENSIEIEVLAPLRNHFVGRALAGDARYSHMARYEEELVAAGLLGPVELIESSH